MKNFFFVVVTIGFILTSSLSVTAQKYIRFINGIDFTTEGINVSPSEMANVLQPEKTIENKNFLSIATEKCMQLQFKYALLLNREVESIANLELFGFIEEWWRTKYRYGGSSKKGIDCSAFTGLLMSCVYAVRLPRTAKAQFKTTKRVSKKELMEGDLVFFNTRGGVSHVGSYLGEGFFVHASAGNGVSISNLDESYYSHRYIGGGRVVAVQDNYAKMN